MIECFLGSGSVKFVFKGLNLPIYDIEKISFENGKVSKWSGFEPKSKTLAEYPYGKNWNFSKNWKFFKFSYFYLFFNFYNFDEIFQFLTFLKNFEKL